MSGLLEIENLRVDFGTRSGPLTAVKDVSLSVAAGEIVGLVGESGSGKSLTCRAVMRLIDQPGRIAGGRIAFDGRDVLAMGERQLRDFRAHEAGMIYQDPFRSLNPVHRIGRQLAETLSVNRGLGRTQARERAIELLDGVGIPDPRRRALSYPHELSGGMRQRVMIALATASEPRLLLADEPTTALDVTTQAQILDLLERLRAERGMAVLLVSHDFGVIARTCDRVAVMYGGHIVETADIATIYTAPEHPYTKALLQSVPELASAGHPRRRGGIAGRPPELGEELNGCVFAPRCAYAESDCTEVEMTLRAVGPAHESACPKRPLASTGAGAPAKAGPETAAPEAVP
ncbi:MAG TPA: ABC transporter ATP-binding protein [Solirubrobacteraceae bacterium]